MNRHNKNKIEIRLDIETYEKTLERIDKIVGEYGNRNKLFKDLIEIGLKQKEMEKNNV